MISVSGAPSACLVVDLLMTSAIWDNRSVFHTATLDYEGYGDRNGVRAVGIGERPYVEPASRV